MSFILMEYLDLNVSMLKIIQVTYFMGEKQFTQINRSSVQITFIS